jgi:hypothetical protein
MDGYWRRCLYRYYVGHVPLSGEHPKYTLSLKVDLFLLSGTRLEMEWIILRWEPLEEASITVSVIFCVLIAPQRTELHIKYLYNALSQSSGESLAF